MLKLTSKARRLISPSLLPSHCFYLAPSCYQWPSANVELCRVSTYLNASPKHTDEAFLSDNAACLALVL